MKQNPLNMDSPIADEIDFVETSVSKRIEQAVNLAVALGENAAISGAPGIGKSTALRWLFDGAGECPFRFFTLDKAIGQNITHLLQQICESYNISAGHSRAICYDRFKRHGRDYFYNEHQIIVLDEAQNLKVDALKDLANLKFDHALNLTFVFCGNEELLNTVNSKQAAFYSLNRRIKQRTTINTIQDSDAVMLIQEFGVNDEQIVRIAQEIGRSFFVDGIVTTMKAAARLAGGGNITLQHVLDALDVYPQYKSAITRRK